MSKTIKPTESELEILNILWKRGPSSVRDVHGILQISKDAGYTTTLKLMQIMYEKNLLARNTEAKSHIYEAAVSQQDTQGQILKRMIDTVFNGSASQLVMQALGDHKTDKKELEQIMQYLKEVEKNA